MVADTLTYSGTLVVHTCWCGIAHAIPYPLSRQAQESGHAVYCPLGHEWVTTKSETDRLREQLHEEQRRRKAARDLLAAEERSHAATRGHLTRAKTRHAAGVCPCCNRTFQQLARHVKTKHPDYTVDAS